MPANAAPPRVNASKSSEFGISVTPNRMFDAEVDEEDLHDHRRAAEHPDVEARENLEHAQARHAHERRHEAQDDPENLRDDRDVDRREERGGERRVDTEDPVPERLPVEGGEHLGAPRDDCATLHVSRGTRPTSSTWRGSSPSSRRRTWLSPAFAPCRSGRRPCGTPSRPGSGSPVSRRTRTICHAGCSTRPRARRRSRRRRGRSSRAFAASVSLGNVTTLIAGLPFFLSAALV